MRKLFCSLCIVMLLFFCSAFAEESKEIVFQDIPWGSSVETIADWITHSGYKSPSWQGDNYFAFFPVNDGADTVLKSDGELANFKELNHYRSALKSWSAINDMLCPGFEIAGYPILNSQCVFLSNGETTKLIAVRVDLNYNALGGIKAFMDDMLLKLRSVYGPSDISDDTQYFKLGVNNTAVLLCNGSLVYGDTNAMSMLEEMVGPFAEPKPTVDSNNTNGL